MEEVKPTGKDKGIAVGIGVAFMVLALIPQIITQEIPSLVVIFKYGIGNAISILTKFELANAIIWSLFVGGTAAVYQEVMKYFSVNTQSKYLTIWIGLGFALVDIAVIFIEGGHALITHLASIFTVLVVLNIISSLLFHPGTALILKYGRTIRKGAYFLLFTILLHGIDDGGLVFTDIYIINNPGSYTEAIMVFWAVAIAVSLLSFLMGMVFRKRMFSSRVDENTI